MTINAVCVAFLCFFGVWWTARDVPSHTSAPARIDISWVASEPLGTFRLRGRFLLRGLDQDFSASISNRTGPALDVSRVEVPPGTYSLTLDEGYQLERTEQGGEQNVPARAFAPGPLLIVTQAGRHTPVGLALVVQAEPLAAAPACIN